MALNAAFCLSNSTPLPDSTNRAGRFAAFAGPTAVQAFWDKQLVRVGGITKQHAASATQWMDNRTAEIAPSKSAHAPAIAFLMILLWTGRHLWIKHFISGFATDGALFQDPTYPAAEKVEIPSSDPPGAFSPTRQRFLE